MPKAIQVVWGGHWRYMTVETLCEIHMLAIGTIEGTQQRVLAKISAPHGSLQTKWIGRIVMEGFTGGTLSG